MPPYAQAVRPVDAAPRDEARDARRFVGDSDHYQVPPERPSLEVVRARLAAKGALAPPPAPGPAPVLCPACGARMLMYATFVRDTRRRRYYKCPGCRHTLQRTSPAARLREDHP